MKARKKPRSPISAAGTCRDARGARWDAALSDIAEGGCRIADPAGRLAQGDQIRLTIAGTGPHHAEVRWRRGHAAGLAFLRPLAAEMLDQLAVQAHLCAPGFGPALGRAAPIPAAAPAAERPPLRRIF